MIAIDEDAVVRVVLTRGRDEGKGQAFLDEPPIDQMGLDIDQFEPLVRMGGVIE